MATTTTTTFEVQGTGRFPIDMLRYDMCWPAREGDSALILASFDRPTRLPGEPRVRTVALNGPREPTEGRWDSFGWKVVPS